MATREEARKELARRELARRRGIPVSELLEQIRQSGPKNTEPDALTRFSRAAIGSAGKFGDMLRTGQQGMLGEFAAPIDPNRNVSALTNMGITDPSALTAEDLASTMGRQVPGLALGAAMRPAAMGAELVAGAGGGLGEFTGRQVGGNVGALVGGLGGSLTGAGVAGGAQALLGGTKGAQANQALRAATGAPVGLGEAGGTGFARFLERVSARIPGGSLVARRRATRIALQVANRAQGVGQRLTQAVDPEIAGGAIREGFGSAMERFKTISGKLFTRSSNLSAGHARTPARYGAAVNKLQAEAQKGATASAGVFNKDQADLIGEVHAAFQRDFATSPQFTMAQMEQLRSRIGAELSNVDIIGTPREGTAKLLYKALTEDMRLLAGQAGPQARKAFESANGFYKGNLEKLLRINKAIVNKQTDSQIFDALVSRAQKGPEIVRDLRARLPRENFEMAAGMALKRMGRENPGKTIVTEAGEAGFSLETFLSNWDRYNKGGTLRVLFEGSSPAMRGAYKDLTQIAKVAAGSRELMGSLPNASNTAEVAVAAGGLGAATAAAGMGFLPEAIAGLTAAVATSSGIQGLLQSPKFIGWLATSTRIPVGQLPAHMERLERVIQEEPQSAALAQGIIDELRP